VNLSHVFAGQRVGVTQVGERIWLVTFMHYDLGYFDDDTCRLEAIESPFGPKVLLGIKLPPLRSEWTSVTKRLVRWFFLCWCLARSGSRGRITDLRST
jgi:hypothetical protein